MNEPPPIPPEITKLIDDIVWNLPYEHKAPAKAALEENWKIFGCGPSTVLRANGFGYHARFIRSEQKGDPPIPNHTRILGSMLVTVAESRGVSEAL